MQALTGHVALITGASRGIGAAIARLFASEGAAVAVHGRDATAVAPVVAEIRDHGGPVVGVIGDLLDPAAVARIVDEAESALGPLSVLVANAGGNTVPPVPLEHLTPAQWREVVDANLTVTFQTIAAVLPGMRQRRRGAIVTISSAASRRPTSFTPVPYAAAKAGVEVLTRLVALQAGPDGVRAACIAPETIVTERSAMQIPRETQVQLAQAHPLRRLGTPDDVARAALYLASDAAAWTTGVVLDVAGGSVLA